MAYILIFVFALFDTLSTIALVSLGLATEINPAVDFLLKADPYWFATVKITLTSLIIAWLYKWKYRPKARILTKFTVAFYGLIAAMHCVTYIYYSGL